MQPKQIIRGRFEYKTSSDTSGVFTYWLNDMHRFTSQEKQMWIPPMPNIMQEKIALLDLRGKGERMDGVGRKQSMYVYYLHLTPKEVHDMESEYEELLKRSDLLGFSKHNSKSRASV